MTLMLAFYADLQKGFVEAHSDDGLLEIFGLKEGWHASFVMAELIKAKHIAQVPFFCLSFCITCLPDNPSNKHQALL